MLVREVKHIARQWIAQEAQKLPGMLGAFYHGSINWSPDESAFSSTSDVDLVVITEPGNLKPGKLVFNNLILDISYMPEAAFRDPQDVLTTYYLAGSFAKSPLFEAKSNQLSAVHTEVVNQYAHRSWVIKRCENACQNCMRYFQRFDQASSLDEKVSTWLFARGVMAHVLLTAGLKNPTVRRRYVDVKALLRHYGALDYHEQLLHLSGFDVITPGQAKGHLLALGEIFDNARSARKSSYRFSSDISDAGRVLAVDGSAELIEAGYHREAMFWIVATFARCMHILTRYGNPPVGKTATERFDDLLADLGLESEAAFDRSNEMALDFLPSLREQSFRLMRLNPEIAG